MNILIVTMMMNRHKKRRFTTTRHDKTARVIIDTIFDVFV